MRMQYYAYANKIYSLNFVANNYLLSIFNVIMLYFSALSPVVMALYKFLSFLYVNYHALLKKRKAFYCYLLGLNSEFSFA